MILSSKTKESIKTALAMTIAWFAQERWTFMLFLYWAPAPRFALPGTAVMQTRG